tara:strand:+ start:1430 stop:2326 length:897 start_codon:yes stop_codon:yes gene_type:complete
MWRSHYVVLGEEPSKSCLARVTDGYQLWQETLTGLFYLTAHSKPLGRRPDFSQFLNRRITHRIDVSLLERFLSDGSSALNPTVSFDLIQRTATLAKQLDMPVLAAEDTDDEYGMAVLVDNGAVKYLRFKAMLKEASEDESAVELVYTHDAGFVIEQKSAEEIYGVAQKAVEEVYGKAGLNLCDYCSNKPTREEAKRDTVERDISIEAYLDSYGVFKRLSHASPQLTLLQKLLVPFRYLTSIILFPAIVVGMVIYALIYSGKTDADLKPNIRTVSLIGMAVLALPILLIIWLVRAMLGY